MPQKSTTTEGMQRAGAEMNVAHADLRGYMSTLQNELDALRGSWKEEAAAVFDQTMLVWREKFSQASLHLTTMEGYLMKGQQEIETGAETNTGTVNAIKI